jgi:hypothetical protein
MSESDCMSSSRIVLRYKLVSPGAFLVVLRDLRPLELKSAQILQL